jgi:hypothetical protein
MRPSERIAKLLIERVFPEAYAEPVVVQSHGEWDLDVYSGETAFPMEVTQATSGRSESLYGAIVGADGQGCAVPRSQARGSWAVTVSRLTNVRKVRKRLDQLLAALETTGLTMFDVRDPEMADKPEVRALWEELRITDGFSNSDWQVPNHELMAPIDSAMLASDQVVSAVQREVDKEDNLKKLARSNAPERHLFVHIAYHSYPAYEAMRTSGLPMRGLHLPSEITHVWVARAFGEAEYLLWAFDSRGWRSYGRIALSAVAPDA